MKTWRSWLFLSCTLLCVTCATFSQAEIPIANVEHPGAVDFEKEILPVFRAKCLACHNRSAKKGGLVLETPESIRKGGDSGTVIVPGNGAESLLLQVAAQTSEPYMPPAKNPAGAEPLTPQELGLLKLWIDQGATGEVRVSISPQRWQRVPQNYLPVQAVAISPDAQYVAAARGNQLVVYHVGTGNLTAELSDVSLQELARPGGPPPAHRDVIQALTFHPQGDLLASAAFREVKLWRKPRDARPWQVAAAGKPMAVAADPSRQWIAVGDEQGRVHVWQVGHNAPLATLQAHQGPVRTLQFVLASGELLSGGEDRTICRWQLPTGQLVSRIDTPTPARTMAIVGPLPQRSDDPFLAANETFWLATAGEDSLIRLWSLATATGKTWDISTVITPGVDPHGRWLATVDVGKNVKVLDVESGQTLASWQVAETPQMVCLAKQAADAPPDRPPLVFLGYSTGAWQCYEASNGALRFAGHAAIPNPLSWSVTADGQAFAVGGENGACAWFRLPVDTPALEPLGLSMVERCATSSDQQWALMVGLHDNQPVTVLFDVNAGRVVGRRSWSEPVRSITVSSETGRAAVATTAAVYVINAREANLPDMAVMNSLPTPPVTIALSGDGQRVLVAGEDHVARIWNLADTAQPIELRGHQAPLMHVFWWQGNQPVTVSADRTIRFWNAADGSQQRSIDVPDVVRAFRTASDGNRFAVATADGHIRVIETASGRQLLAVAAPWPEVDDLAFSADGNRLLATSRGRGAMLWELNYGQSAALALERWDDAKLAATLYGRAPENWYSIHQDGQITRQGVRFQRWITGMNQPVVALRIHPNGQQLYSLTADGTLRGHRTADGQTFFTVGHGSPAKALGISWDGQWLATGGEDGQVRVFQSGNGGAAPQQPAGRFTGPVFAVAFTPNNARVIAAGGGDNTEIRLWDLAGGTWLERMARHGQKPLTMVVIGSGLGHVVSGPVGEPLVAWQPHAVKVLTGSSQEVTSLAVNTAAPQELLSGGRDGVLRRWNVLNGQQLQQFGHGSPIAAIAVRPDGQRYATAGENGTTRLWNASNGQVVAELRGDIRTKLLLADRNRELAAANARLNVAKQRAEAVEKEVPVKQEAAKKAAEALDAANKQVEEKAAQVRTTFEAKIAQEKAAVEAAAAAQRASAAKQMADALAAETAQMAQRLRERANRLSALAQASPQDPALAKAAEDARRAADEAQNKAQQAAAAQPPAQQAYEAATRTANEAAAKVAEVQKPYNDAVAALRTAEMAQNLAAQNHRAAERERQAIEARLPVVREQRAAMEKTVQQAQELLQQTQQLAAQAEQPQRTVAFSPDGQQLATGSAYPHIQLWDGLTGAPLSSLVGHSQPVTGTAFLSTQLLVSCAEDGQVTVWDSQPSWQLERTLGNIDDPALFTHRIMAVDFSRDGSRLAVGGGMPSRDGFVHLFDVPSGQLVLSIPNAHDDTVYALQFSPDGKWLASAAADKFVKIFDVSNGQLVRRLEGHTSYVLGVAWRSDGSLLASCGADRTVKIWEPETGDQTRTIEGFGKPVTVVRFMGESENIVSGCGDGTIRMHNALNGGNFRNFGGAGYVHNLAISIDQQWLVAGSADGGVRLWNATNGQFIRNWSP